MDEITAAFAHAEEITPASLPRYQWRMVVGALRTEARRVDAIADRAKHAMTKKSKTATMYREIANALDDQRS